MGSLSWAFTGLTLNMRHTASFLLVLALVPLSLGKPGMLTWICKTCRNPTMIYSAEAEISAGDGATVGQLRLEQHVTREESGVAGPVMIDTVDNREKLASMKTYSFQVQIQKGSCNNLVTLLLLNTAVDVPTLLELPSLRTKTTMKSFFLSCLRLTVWSSLTRRIARVSWAVVKLEMVPWLKILESNHYLS